jgi:Golgi SNAP receptor complex protein 2
MRAMNVEADLLPIFCTSIDKKQSTQRKMLDAANTLGLSRNVIQLIERRSSEDKWIFYAGVCVTLLALWAIIHYLT